MARQDHYEVLGVTQNATPEEIRRAFRRLAGECHPDRNPGDRAASLRFKQINTAHQVLSDEGTRALYDDLTRGPDATRTGVNVPPPRPPPPSPRAPPPPPEPDRPPPEGSRSWSWRPGAQWAPPAEPRQSSAPPPYEPAQNPPPQPPPEWAAPTAAPEPVAYTVPRPPAAVDEGRVAHPERVRWVRRLVLRAPENAVAATALLFMAVVFWPLGDSSDVRVVDAKTGRSKTLPQEAVATAHAKGEIAFAPGTRVPVILDGQPGTISAEQVDAAIASGRASLDLDPSGAIKAERAAFRRGFTFGASDWMPVEVRKFVGDPEGADRASRVLDALKQDNLGPAEGLGRLAAFLVLALNAMLYLAARMLSGLSCPRCRGPLREQDARCPGCGQAFWTAGGGFTASPPPSRSPSAAEAWRGRTLSAGARLAKFALSLLVFTGVVAVLAVVAGRGRDSQAPSPVADHPPATPADPSSSLPAEEAIVPEWPVDDGRFSGAFPEAPSTKRDATKGVEEDVFVAGGAVVMVLCAPPSTAAGWRTTASNAGWRRFDFYGTTAMSEEEHEGGETYLREQLEVRGRYCLLGASYRDAVPSELAIAQAFLRSFRPKGAVAPVAQSPR